MKKYIFIMMFGTLFTSCGTKEKETRNLEKFDKVNLVGSVELHLVRDSDHSMKIMTKKASNIANLVTEVRNGELYIYYDKKDKYTKSPNYVIYLNHSGISDLTLSGVVKLITDDDISQNDLAISGNGVFNGNMDVMVENLNVDLHGISNISISGNAEVANIKMTGIGMIDAKNLETNSANKRVSGVATVLLSNH